MGRMRTPMRSASGVAWSGARWILDHSPSTAYDDFLICLISRPIFGRFTKSSFRKVSKTGAHM